jgi:hypothetical protein
MSCIAGGVQFHWPTLGEWNKLRYTEAFNPVTDELENAGASTTFTTSGNR